MLFDYRRTFDEKAVQILERDKIRTEKGRMAKQGYSCFFNKGRACINVNFRSSPGAGRFPPPSGTVSCLLGTIEEEMAKGWYVVHTYSGYENKIEKTIRRLMNDPDFSEFVFDIKVPAEEVVEIKDGKKKTSMKKILPGYILLEMDLPDLGWKQICSQIRRIQGVTGFVGTMSGSKPQPITAEEARGIFQKTGEIKTDKISRPKQSFTHGDMVKIIDGPFDTFTGTIEEVFPDKSKLKVMVGIFGRSTPVEVDFNQVEKV